MKKYLFILLLIFPFSIYGQTYSGYYRAIFFNFLSEPRRIIAEFEIKPDNSVSAQVKIGSEVKILSGMVDKKGNFEAVSQPEGNLIYKIKGKLNDKEHKISFIQRVEQRSIGSKSVSENGMQGTFEKVEKPAESKPVTVIADGKSRLKFQQSAPLFGDEWTGFSASVTKETDQNGIVFKILIEEKNDERERRVSIVTRSSLPTEKIWKPDGTDIAYAGYKEQNKTTKVKNSFSASYDNYRNSPQYQGGSLEIVSETETQIVFKLTDFKIKRLLKDDFIRIDGFIYADKVK